LVIGGVRSGEGKTTVALGLMAAWRARGLTVQGFKIGPDYLDTGYQFLATERVGRNLDLWMMGEKGVRRSLAQHGGTAEISVIEGVMGLYDGHRDGVTPTSSAEVAKRLDAPVVLVMDAGHLAASAGAVALGFRTFDPEVQLAGVILNRWNPSRSRLAVEQAMERAGLPVLGYLPAMPDVALPSRHLGLVLAEEIEEEVSAALHTLGGRMAEFLDLDRLQALARAAPPVAAAEITFENIERAVAESPVRIGVARDEAFAFYYPDNLELLEAAGAELVFFSPLEDRELPSLDGLYLGGGYPELHARLLTKNARLRASIARAIAAGLPTYAECGGLMYLCETITDLEGKNWPMVGAVPRQVHMHTRLQRMGYREGLLPRDSILAPAGVRLRGHEFHYSSSTPEAGEYAAYAIEERPEGYSRGNLFASYMHLHFAGCPQVVDHWLGVCRTWMHGKMR